MRIILRWRGVCRAFASRSVFCDRTNSARAIYRDTNSSRDVHEAVAILEDVFRTTRRVFGLQHPIFAEYRQDLETARMRQADDESREAFTAPAPPTP